MLEENLEKIKKQINGRAKLIAVSKKKPKELIQQAYAVGQLDFGENYVQELIEKATALPQEIRWHQIGYLQTNKVKFIAPFVHCIHSVHSEKLALEINKQASKHDRVIPCLLQVHIAREKSKSGFSKDELKDFVSSEKLNALKNIKIEGIMGMATFTTNHEQVENEFRELKLVFEELKKSKLPPNAEMKDLSMGMSGDWQIALRQGSTMIRLGSAIFGERK